MESTEIPGKKRLSALAIGKPVNTVGRFGLIVTPPELLHWRINS
jgi:hypothetical protein